MVFLAVCLCLQAAGLVLAENDAYVMTAVYRDETRMLDADLSVAYTNTTGEYLDHVMFTAYANCLRRESTLPYDNAALEAAFPYGYAPSGMVLSEVSFNGARARYGFLGESECFLRVECALAPGQTGTFRFVYTLLLSENRAFLGCGEDLRLELFYPCACVYREGFVLNAPSRAGRYAWADPADYTLILTLPEGYEPAGAEQINKGPGNTWTLESRDMPGFALYISRRFYTCEGEKLRVRANSRAKARTLLASAEKALSFLESRFGAADRRVDIVISSCPDSRILPGLIILGTDAEGDEAYFAVRGLAQQFFDRADPATDPFLTAGIGEYLALEELAGREGSRARSEALRTRVQPALKLTLPGGLTPDSPLPRFSTRAEYDTAAAKRGAAVLTEMAGAYGRDTLLAALALYRGAETQDIQSFVACMDEAAGTSTGEALIAHLYGIEEYVNYIGDIY